MDKVMLKLHSNSFLSIFDNFHQYI